MYLRLLEAGVKDASCPVSRLSLLSDGERLELVKHFNGTAVAHSNDDTFVEMFAAQSARNPDAVAIIVDEQSISYAELDVASNKLARFLIGRGVGPEVVVGVCLDRGQLLIVTLLAILKAGGAYLPLDPDYPEERLSFILQDSKARIVLTTSALRPRFVAGISAVELDEPSSESTLGAMPADVIRQDERSAPITDSALAYVIYTSGSTGTPKGVMVGHGALAALCRSAIEAYALEGGDRVLQFASLAFTQVVEEVFPTLIAGGRLVIFKSRDGTLLDDLRRLGQERRVDVVTMVPSLLKQIAPRDLASVSRIIATGERLDSDVAAAWSYGRVLYNEYGASETTVSSASGEVGFGETVTVGRPMRGTAVYVVDSQLNPQPIGVVGELLVGGQQVARGYRGHARQTAERFIADPFSDQDGARLFRTGDLARWCRDGTLEFMGRLDHQVKIRGMRVEPGEIERVLESFDDVAHAVVVCEADEDGDQRLLAYIVPIKDSSTLWANDITKRLGVASVAEDLSISALRAALEDGDVSEVSSILGIEALDTASAEFQRILQARETVPLDGLIDLQDLRNELGRTLPDYMVPSAFVGLMRIPLTASGKIDRKALPKVEASIARAAYLAPRNETEALICQIMRDVVSHDRFDLERVGVDDHFFDIGGHSILAAQFSARLERSLGRPVPVRLVFEAPTAAQLAKRLEQENSESERLPEVVSVDRGSVILASFEQERMWLLNEMLGRRPVYNEGLSLLIRGTLDSCALIAAVQGLLDRYEALRTRIVPSGGHLTQVIAPVGSLRVDVEDWTSSNLERDRLETKAAARATQLLATPYDLTKDHPCRALVIKLDETVHLWCLAVHHVVGDNWSLSHILPADFKALYLAHAKGEEPALPEIGLHYADYAAWQRGAEMTARHAEQLRYWRNQLAGIPQAIDLASDRPRPDYRDYAGGRMSATHLSTTEWRSVEDFAVRHDATPFVVFWAALASLLHRLSGSPDIVVGTSHTIKPNVELWREFGYFGNTLVLRAGMATDDTFEAVMARCRKTLFEAFQNQDLPFEEVIRATGRNPQEAGSLFQVLLVMHAYFDLRGLDLGGVELELLGERPATAKYDLTIDINPGPDGVVVSIAYAKDMFDAPSIKRLGSFYKRLLLEAIDEPERRIADLTLLDEAERHLVLERFNQTVMPVSDEKTVVELFSEQVRDAPERIALVEGERSMTYEDLDRQSNRLARHLIALGVGPEVVVGLCLERSLDLIVGLFAILKAGGAYLPLDPEYPRKRLAFMVQDSGSLTVIANRKTAAGLDLAPGQLLLLDEPAVQESLLRESGAAPTEGEQLDSATPGTLAYVLYTSGSTGVPKGVSGTHAALSSRLTYFRKLISLTSDDCLLSITNPAFDGAIRELLLWATAGARLVIADRRAQEDVRLMLAEVAAQGITCLRLSPGLLQLLLEHCEAFPEARLEASSIATALIGGEGVSASAVESLYQMMDRDGSFRVFHVYGSTEAQDATIHLCRRSEGGPVPIGGPVTNMRTYVVDSALNPQPIGVAGELVVAGLQLARSYVGRPDLTAERFIADPYSGEAGGRVYRTGDLARWRSDGTLELLGRSDRQIKIRGMRVELGEIEAALMAQEAVAQAAASVEYSSQGDERLIAYLVPAPAQGAREDQTAPDEALSLLWPQCQTIDLDGGLDLEVLRDGLSEMLPDHMIPTGFIGLNRLPMTASGKIDRQALPKAEWTLVRRRYAAPRTETEATVVETIAALLGVERVGIGDDFFALGGHSLLALRLVAELGHATGKSLSVKSIFESATLGEIAAVLDAEDGESYRPLIHLDRMARARAQHHGDLPLLFCFHAASGHATVYEGLVTPLAGVAEVVGVQARGLQEGEAAFETYGDMLATYLEAVAGRAAGRPFALLGWSFGGYLAFDIANRIADEGREPQGLIILDSVDRWRELLPAAEVEAREAIPDFDAWLYHSVLRIDPDFDWSLVATSDRDAKLRAIAEVAAAAGEIDQQGLLAGPETLQRLATVWHHHSKLMMTRPASRPFPGRAIVCRASDTREAVKDPSLGWSGVCGDVESVDLPFGHRQLTSPAALVQVATLIRGLFGCRPKEEQTEAASYFGR